MKKNSCFLLLCFCATLAAQSFPYPQARAFSRCIKPDNATQEQVNNTIVRLYACWKKCTLKKIAKYLEVVTILPCRELEALQ